MCPFCKNDAPIVYRGVVPYCTACNRMRAPLTARSVNLAGKPSLLGGTVASVFGWIVLGIGGALAVGLGLLAYALFTATAGLAVGLPVALIALTIGLLLMRGGKSLKATGAFEQKDTHAQAVFALAQHRGGVLTALDVAQALGMRPADADALLTDLAKTQSDQCVLEVDDNGAIYYRFANAPWTADPRYRVGVAFDANLRAQSAARVAAQDEAPASTAPQVIDAELIDEEPARRARRAR
jgi:hypothetical protein